jgi:hypothetical protein
MKLNGRVGSQGSTNFLQKSASNCAYAEVTFAWEYPSESQPKLVVLHNGQVIFEGLMDIQNGQDKDQDKNSFLQEQDQLDFYQGQDSQTTADDGYSLTLLMQENQNYDYFFEVDGERKYDFDLDFRTVDLFNYAKATQNDIGNGFGAKTSSSKSGKNSTKQSEMPIVAH